MDQPLNQSRGAAGSRFRRYGPIFAELWIVGVTIGYFAIRILGSGLGRRYLHVLLGR